MPGWIGWRSTRMFFHYGGQRTQWGQTVIPYQDFSVSSGKILLAKGSYIILIKKEKQKEHVDKRTTCIFNRQNAVAGTFVSVTLNDLLSYDPLALLCIMKVAFGRDDLRTSGKRLISCTASFSNRRRSRLLCRCDHGVRAPCRRQNTGRMKVITSSPNKQMTCLQ